MELPFFFFFFSFLWGEWDRIKKSRGRVIFLVMARYDLHPIGHDGSIEREREREGEIDRNFTVLTRRTKRLCRRVVGRSVAE